MLTKEEVLFLYYVTKKLLVKIRKKFYVHSPTRNYPYHKSAEEFYEKCLEDSEFKIIDVGTSSTIFETSFGKFRCWTGNRPYACLEDTVEIDTKKHPHKFKHMPSQWTVKEFLKRVEKFEQGE